MKTRCSQTKSKEKRNKIRLVKVTVTGKEIVGDFVLLRSRKVRKVDRRRDSGT